jgi:hypothetical protein
MNVTPYEKTYVCVDKSLKATEDLNRIVDILKRLDHPVSCKELGELAYGEAYKRPKVEKDHCMTWEQIKAESKACSLTSRLTHMLSHLVEGNFVKVSETLSEPYTFETDKYISVDADDKPRYITVWDAQGRTYDIPNPDFKGGARYKKITVTETHQKKINVYSWVKGA